MPRADRPWLRCRRSDTSSVGPAFNGVFVGVPPDAVTEGDGWVNWSGLATELGYLAGSLSNAAWLLLSRHGRSAPHPQNPASMHSACYDYLRGDALADKEHA